MIEKIVRFQEVASVGSAKIDSTSLPPTTLRASLPPLSVMGQQQSSIPMTGVYTWDLYENGVSATGFGVGGCKSTDLGFGKAGLYPGAEQLMPLAVFNEFKATMIELCVGYPCK
jgi:hypothetical protein|tara:strand:- start:688 stop:1029 length:342 start_codon:yes stop_codon:yes gene_type:complete